MKRISLLLAALLVTASLAGCGGGKDKETETDTTTQKITEAMTTKPTEKQTQATEPQTEKSTDKIRSLNGLVTGVTADSVEIQTARGKKLIFKTAGVQVQTAAQIAAKSQVTILYKGKIKDTDTSGATVSAIKDMDASAQKITEGELIVAEEADPNATGGDIGGTIQEVTAERIVILGDDGDSYYFTHDNCKITLGSGIQDTNYVTVKYTGDVYGPEIVPAVAITDNTTNSAPEAEKTSTLTGTISSLDTNTVSISTDDGQELTFTITGIPVNVSGGLASGGSISLKYTGDLNDMANATAVAITDSPSGSNNADGADSDTTGDAGNNADGQNSGADDGGNAADLNDEYTKE